MGMLGKSLIMRMRLTVKYMPTREKAIVILMLIVLFYTLLCIITPSFIAKIHGISVSKNPSTSIKPGYYFINYGKGINKGDIAIVCIPSQHYAEIALRDGLPGSDLCRYKSRPLLKYVVASTNDVVKVSRDGILVNNILLPNTKPIQEIYSIKLNPIPVGTTFKLKPSEYVVLGETYDSFDSRYYGVITNKDILGKATYLW